MVSIEKRTGTIAKVLTDHQAELYALINKGDIKGCRKRAIELLDSESITDKKAVATAKDVFSKKNDNLFLSCLVTYMTGLKAS